MHTTVTKGPHAETTITGTLDVVTIQKGFHKSLDRLVSQIDLPGFRKGRAPKDHVLREVGAKSVWRDAAEDALREELIDIFKEHKLVPILPPNITLIVTAEDTDVPFSVTIIGPPTIEIKDYKKTATEALKKVTPLDTNKEKGGARKNIAGQVNAMLGRKDDAPELTDEEAKKLGFENVIALSFFLDQEAVRAVESHDQQRKRSAVADALVTESTYDIPLVMIRDEARAMMEQSKAEIARQGTQFNDYLAKRGMTEEQVIDEMMPSAEKRTALDMLFAKISAEEKLTPDDAEVHRVAHAVMHQGVPKDRAHQYGAEVSIREKIWNVLGIETPLNKSQSELSGDQSVTDIAKLKDEPAGAPTRRAH